MNAPIPAWVGGVLEPVPEIEVHRQGLRHRAVAVFATRGARELLIRQRARAAYLAPGLWSCAWHGHPAWDEDPAACAARLMRDGAAPGAGPPLWRGTAEYRAALAGGFTEHEQVEIFRAGVGGDGPNAATRGGVPDALWIDVEDLLAETRRRAERFAPWLRVALAEHRRLILE